MSDEVLGALGAMLEVVERLAESCGLVEARKERELVRPRGKPLVPVEEDEVVEITDEEVDAAIAEWDKNMPVEARGVLEAREATPEEAARFEAELEEENSG